MSQVAADGSLKFLAETPAQLLVADDLTPVKGEEEDEDAAAESGALPCRTRWGAKQSAYLFQPDRAVHVIIIFKFEIQVLNSTFLHPAPIPQFRPPTFPHV